MNYFACINANQLYTLYTQTRIHNHNHTYSHTLVLPDDSAANEP